MFTCELCATECCNQIKFFEHLKLHYDTSLIQVTNGDIQDHIIQYDTTVQPILQETFTYKTDPQEEEDININCGICGRMFGKQKTFEAHLATAHPQIEEFSEPEDMMEGIRHVVNIQADADEEIEDKISWTYSEAIDIPPEQDPLEIKSNSSVVIQTTYLDNDEFDEVEKGKRRKKLAQCPHCTRTFLHRNSLMYHIRSHTGKRPHQCDVCGKGFYTANALKVHKRMHSGDKPYKCEVCNRRFRQWGDLKYHKTSLHSDSKQYQCEFCGKNFARKYSLIVHCRIHTGEKNYVCEFCNKSFRASSYLLNHRRIHTGEKPYSCDICSKSFRVRSDMKRHRATHNKEVTNVNTQRQPELTEMTALVPEPIPQNDLEEKGTICTQFEVEDFNEVSETTSWKIEKKHHIAY